jgi:penicillin-insensitive murein endopeptidase
VIHPKPSPEPDKPKPGLTLAQLPAECRQVLAAPNAKQ